MCIVAFITFRRIFIEFSNETVAFFAEVGIIILWQHFGNRKSVSLNKVHS